MICFNCLAKVEGRNQPVMYATNFSETLRRSQREVEFTQQRPRVIDESNLRLNPFAIAK